MINGLYLLMIINMKNILNKFFNIINFLTFLIL